MLVFPPSRHSLGRNLILNGVWEEEVTNLLCSVIQKGMTVLDVGADIGYYTLLFAEWVGETGRVIAFEPIPLARERLEYNVHQLNEYTNVTVCGFALSNSNGMAILEKPLTISQIKPQEAFKDADDIEVIVRTLDQCRLDLGIESIDLVKIDVEGAELCVLEGMRGFLEQEHPYLLIEVHPVQLRSFGHSTSDVFQFLKALDYHISMVGKGSTNCGDDQWQYPVAIFCKSGERNSCDTER